MPKGQRGGGFPAPAEVRFGRVVVTIDTHRRVDDPDHATAYRCSVKGVLLGEAFRIDHNEPFHRASDVTEDRPVHQWFRQACRRGRARPGPRPARRCRHAVESE